MFSMFLCYARCVKFRTFIYLNFLAQDFEMKLSYFMKKWYFLISLLSYRKYELIRPKKLNRARVLPIPICISLIIRPFHQINCLPVSSYIFYVNVRLKLLLEFGKQTKNEYLIRSRSVNKGI